MPSIKNASMSPSLIRVATVRGSRNGVSRKCVPKRSLGTHFEDCERVGVERHRSWARAVVQNRPGLRLQHRHQIGPVDQPLVFRQFFGTQLTFMVSFRQILDPLLRRRIGPQVGNCLGNLDRKHVTDRVEKSVEDLSSLCDGNDHSLSRRVPNSH